MCFRGFLKKWLVSQSLWFFLGGCSILVISTRRWIELSKSKVSFLIILSKYYIVSKRVDTTFITPLFCLKAHFSVVIVLDGNFLLVFTFRFKCFMDNVVNNSARKTFTLCSNIPCSNIPCSNYSMFKLFHVNIGQTLVNLLHLCFRLLCYYNSV